MIAHVDKTIQTAIGKSSLVNINHIDTTTNGVSLMLN